MSGKLNPDIFILNRFKKYYIINVNNQSVHQGARHGNYQG